MLDYRVREIGPGEFDESAGVIRQSFRTVADEFCFTPQNNPSNGAFLTPQKLEEEYRRGVRMYGLYRDGRQAGFVALERRDRALYYLEKLSVLPQYRHLGFGRTLLDFARDTVRQAGGSIISIAIIDENTRLKGWYEQYGFRQQSLKRFEHLPFTVCFLTLLV